jgi:predicted O-methyltransferase YrrM
MSPPLTADAFVAQLRENAFAALDVAGHAPDLHGWMDNLFAETFAGFLAPRDRARPLTIVEVGTWKGRSAVKMAETAKALGFASTTLICVDTWLGAPEFWTWGLNDPTRGESFHRKDGYPTVFYTFTRNAKALGHADVIAPLPLSSIQAADVLAYYTIKPDIIYVDAAHEYESVLADLRAYWELLAPGGVLFGDDYVCWPGVTRAVNEFAAAKGLQPKVAGVVWTLHKLS